MRTSSMNFDQDNQAGLAKADQTLSNSIKVYPLQHKEQTQVHYKQYSVPTERYSFARGIGPVYHDPYTTIDRMVSYFLPDSPAGVESSSAFEAQVRHILADSELGGVIDYYRQFPDQAAPAEAVRRWDAGVRVTNIDQFERKIVGDRGWQVVYLGTDTLIDGMDIQLTTDP